MSARMYDRDIKRDNRSLSSILFNMESVKEQLRLLVSDRDVRPVYCCSNISIFTYYFLILNLNGRLQKSTRHSNNNQFISCALSSTVT